MKNIKTNMLGNNFSTTLESIQSKDIKNSIEPLSTVGIGKISESIDVQKTTNYSIKFGKNAKKSKNNPRFYFTNFIEEYCEELYGKIGNIESIVRESENTSIDVKRNDIRMSNLLGLPFKGARQIELLKINSNYRNQNTLRLIFSVEGKNNDTWEMTCLLIDPHHLFIPSKHGNKTKDEMQKETYENNEKNIFCLSKYF